MLYILELSIGLHATNEFKLYNSFSISNFSDAFSISDDKYLNEYQKDLQTKVWNFDPAFSNKRVDMFVTFLTWLNFADIFNYNRKDCVKSFGTFFILILYNILNLIKYESSLIEYFELNNAHTVPITNGIDCEIMNLLFLISLIFIKS